MEDRINKLLAGQAELQTHMSEMRNTWVEFNKTYGDYLRLALDKDRDRAALRKAVIEKSLVMALVTLASFVGVAVSDHVISIFHSAFQSAIK